MMDAVPPGVGFVAEKLTRLFIPLVLTYCALTTLTILSSNLPSQSSSHRLWITLLLQPFIAIARSKYADYVIDRDAKALGAELPPQYPHKEFAGVDIVRMLLAHQKGGYLGDANHILSEGCQGAHTFSISALFQRTIFTSEPEHIKAILATQFTNFEKGKSLFAALKSLLGIGVFNSDGDIWKFHRTTARPFFNKDRVVDFENFERHVQLAFEGAEARLETGTAVDMQDLVARFTMDSATEYLFARDIRSLSAELPYPHDHPLKATKKQHSSEKFTDAVGESQSLIVARFSRGNAWPLWEFWQDKVQQKREIITEYVEPIMEEAIHQRSSATMTTKKTSHESGSMLEFLVEQTDDKQIIRDTIINMLIAGRDTTASALTFTLYMLGEHPEILTRLRREVIDHLGSDMPPNSEDLRELKYLRAVVNETLRLYPPVPVNSRHCVRPTVLPGAAPGEKNIYFPGNVRIAYSVWVMHRRKDLWGPDALEFDPERWLDERNQKYFVKNPFIFLPFNAGPRICLGQQFAYNEIAYFLIRFVQRYSSIALHPELQRSEDQPPKAWFEEKHEGPKGRDTIWPKSHLTLYSKGGLWMTMQA